MANQVSLLFQLVNIVLHHLPAKLALSQSLDHSEISSTCADRGKGETEAGVHVVEAAAFRAEESHGCPVVV